MGGGLGGGIGGGEGEGHALHETGQEARMLSFSHPGSPHESPAGGCTWSVQVHVFHPTPPDSSPLQLLLTLPMASTLSAQGGDGGGGERGRHVKQSPSCSFSRSQIGPLPLHLELPTP